MGNAGIFQGSTKASLALDGFVTMHSACALLFASAMLFRPSLFALFTKDNDFPLLAEDSIRWASPFVYGFGLLAGLSLTMHAEERVKVACLYTLALGMAVPIGLFVQSTGRWNALHPLNIVLFASLSAGYATFICGARHAFSRTETGYSKEDDNRSVLKGESQMSRMLDGFVMMHSVCAASFASAMLFAPWFFGLFIKVGELPQLSEDAIRWASPFVFGYAMLAALSLTMRAGERYKVACIFAITLFMDLPIGGMVQVNGRWNAWHALNIIPFTALSAGYASFICCSPQAFDRTR